MKINRYINYRLNVGGLKMQVYLNSVTGIDDAITSMFMSKRTWTRELEVQIRDTVEAVCNTKGKFIQPGCNLVDVPDKVYDNYTSWVASLTKWGPTHITMLRYIDFSVTVEGLHRGGQDDWDAHAKRYENRIIRTSTRMVQDVFKHGEKSDFYKDKILTSDEAFELLGITIPDKVEKDGVTYVKTVNGYIREDMKDNQDVKRGLYMLSIPSNFIFKVNLTEFAHVYKERNINGRANPEVKQCCEAIADQIAAFQPMFTRELLDKIKN